jgi:hypothetical protein
MTKSKDSSWFSSTVFRRDLSIIGLVAVIIAIPLTVLMSQTQQETRQRAASTECVYAFNTTTVCNSYCSGQPGKTCQQNPKGLWGCCGQITTPTPTLVVETAPMWCSRCSDSYRYCHVSWQSTQGCTDTANAKYVIDCSCTQGALDCGLKGIDTSTCKGKIALPTNNPIRKTPVSPIPTVKP